MLLRPSTCPICQRAIGERNVQCLHCGCVVQFTPEPPIFSRGAVVEALVQPTIKLTRERIARNPAQGSAHYVLGLCYLNLSFVDRGSAEFQQALTLMPDNHVVHFELAMVQYTQGKYASALDQVKQARELDPSRPEYLYMEYYLAAHGEFTRGRMEEAVSSLILAYEFGPEWRLAAADLEEFIALNEGRLATLNIEGKRNVDPRLIDYLRLLAADPRAQEIDLPPAPPQPVPPGALALGVLRTVAPGVAERMNSVYEDRLKDYQRASEEREQQRRAAIGQLKVDIAAWREQMGQIRSNLGLMATLCLAMIRLEEQDAESKAASRDRGRGARTR